MPLPPNPTSPNALRPDGGNWYIWWAGAWSTLVPTGGVATSAGQYAIGNTTASTSSTTGALSALSLSGAGGISVGLDTTGVGAPAWVISGPNTVASATSMGQTVIGNTTADTSSQTRALLAETISGAGIVSVGFSAGSLLISASSGTTAASGTVQNLTALGNTTAATSSFADTLSARSYSFAGGASGGFDTNGVLIVSGATTVAQSVQTIGGFATGNTTGSSSSTTFDARSVTVSGAGDISVGYSSNNILIVSGSAPPASGTAENMVAIGNTTGATSSSVLTLTALTVSGVGGASVGFSTTAANAGVLMVSAPQGSGTVNSIVVRGNTTGAGGSSSSTQTLGSLSFSGVGGVSIGMSTTAPGQAVIVVSGATTAASGTAENLVAIGNTTAATSSSVLTLTALTVSGAGGASVGLSTTGAGSGVLIISGATTVASGTANSIVALGNTTAATSSSVETLGSLSLSGAGIVSIGLSTTAANAGVVVISAPTPAASGTVNNLFALGNTTGATSSTTETLTNLSFSAAGAASIGFSTTAAGAGVVIISGATAVAATNSFFALGNTTGATTSIVSTGGLSFSAGGNMAAGFSTTGAGASVLQMSVPFDTIQIFGDTVGASSSTTRQNTLSLSAAGGVVSLSLNAGRIVITGTSATAAAVFMLGNTTGTTSSGLYPLLNPVYSGAGDLTVGYSSSTIVISGPATRSSLSTLEPVPLLGSTTTSIPNAFMFMAPFIAPEALVINQVRLIGTFTLAPLTFGSTKGSSSASASASSGLSVVIYSAMGGASSNSYTSLTSASVVFSLSQTFSVSSSTTMTNGLSLSYPSGTTTASTNLSTTAGASAALVQNASTSNFSSWREIDVPLAATLPPGNYIVGFQANTASAGGSAVAWWASVAGMTHMTVMPGVMGATTVEVLPGIGVATVTAASVIPTTFNALSLASSASMFRPYCYMGVF